MLQCNGCKAHLIRARFERSSFWYCPKCKGKLFAYNELAKVKGSEHALTLLKTPVKNKRLGKQDCPSCYKKMQLVFSGAGVTELDTCRQCKLVWFDNGEIKLTEDNPQVLHKPATIVEGKRKHSDWEEPDPPYGFSNPESDINLFVMALLRIPEEHIERTKNDTHTSRFLVLLAVLVTLLSMSFFKEKVTAAVAFYPLDPFRDYGIRWIISIFAHGGISHLFSNCYFLWLFGDNVEDFLGSIKFLELFFFAALLGDLAVIFFDPHPLPTLGASGAISGLSIFYMLNFPHGKLSILIPYINLKAIAMGGDWIGAMRLTVPVWGFVGVFILLELFNSYLQLRGLGGRVSHLSHIGGAVGGLFFWFLFGSSKKLA